MEVTWLMKREWMMLGPTPYEEDCVQLSRDGENATQMRDEVNRYVQMLRTRFPFAPTDDSGEEMAWFARKSESHDFGTYYEAAVYYYMDDDEATNFAFFVEGRCPGTWDDDKVYTKEEYEAWKQRNKEQYA